jgi:thioredoxin reductase (NADPH)
MPDHDRHAAAFTKLDEGQLASLEHCPLTMQKRFRDGEKLFEVGDRDFKFYVVRTGAIELLDESGEMPRIVTVLRRGEFTGEVTQLTGGPSIVSGIARGECQVFEISSESLRQILNYHPSPGDVILQTFIARRKLLRESGDFLGVCVIGSRDSRETFRVREFLAKNGVPSTWLDLEDDPQVKQLLARFGVSEAETPVVIRGHKLLLRNPTNRQLAEALGLRRPLGSQPDCR